ncbi:MAG: FtsX-like permease family protein [Candidatus Neomarinimicrobiota bacterium]|nr:FtsX-like permease family protein [Candidatus Neomarinimicrobiota bacterium]
MFNSKHIGPSRLTGLIAVIGISLGTMAMVLSVSVLNGFESRIIEKIIGFEGDIKLSGEIEFNQSIQILSSIDEIDSFIPYTERVGLIINRENKSRMITFKSIETEMISTFYNIKFVEKTESDLPMIYLGRTTADRLNLRLGDLVKLMSPLDQNIVWGVPRSVKVIIGGIFDVQILDFNDKMIFIPHEVGKKLFLRKKGFDGIDIRLINEGDPSKVKKIIQKKVTNSHLETWSEVHNNLFSAMRLERIGSLVVLSLIVLVGCFNLTTTLMLITIQKIRHFGILTAIGASKNNIHNIIFKQGFFTGLIGIFFGLLISLGFIIVQNIFGLIKLPEDIYFTTSLPMIINASDLIVISAITLFMIFISSLIASKRIDSFKIINSIVSDK